MLKEISYTNLWYISSYFCLDDSQLLFSYSNVYGWINCKDHGKLTLALLHLLELSLLGRRTGTCVESTLLF